MINFIVFVYEASENCECSMKYIYIVDYNMSRSFILRSMVINSYLPVLFLWMWH